MTTVPRSNRTLPELLKALGVSNAREVFVWSIRYTGRMPPPPPAHDYVAGNSSGEQGIFRPERDTLIQNGAHDHHYSQSCGKDCTT
jgi:hypothetical protein